MFRLPKLVKPKGFTKGFTVIELLVVLAIIAILFSIFVPIFMASRDKAAGAGSGSDIAIITVDHRERVSQGYGETLASKYLIFTKEGEVFEDTDNLFLGKFNSSDIYGQIREGHTYRVRTSGYRMPALSYYRNIVSVEGEVAQVPEGGSANVPQVPG